MAGRQDLGDTQCNHDDKRRDLAVIYVRCLTLHLLRWSMGWCTNTPYQAMIQGLGTRFKPVTTLRLVDFKLGFQPAISKDVIATRHCLQLPYFIEGLFCSSPSVHLPSIQRSHTIWTLPLTKTPPLIENVPSPRLVAPCPSPRLPNHLTLFSVLAPLLRRLPRNQINSRTMYNQDEALVVQMWKKVASALISSRQACPYGWIMKP